MTLKNTTAAMRVSLKIPPEGYSEIFGIYALIRISFQRPLGGSTDSFMGKVPTIWGIFRDTTKAYIARSQVELFSKGRLMSMKVIRRRMMLEKSIAVVPHFKVKSGRGQRGATLNSRYVDLEWFRVVRCWERTMWLLIADSIYVANSPRYAGFVSDHLL